MITIIPSVLKTQVSRISTSYCQKLNGEGNFCTFQCNGITGHNPFFAPGLKKSANQKMSLIALDIALHVFVNKY